MPQIEVISVQAWRYIVYRWDIPKVTGMTACRNKRWVSSEDVKTLKEEAQVVTKSSAYTAKDAIT